MAGREASLPTLESRAARSVRMPVPADPPPRDGGAPAARPSIGAYLRDRGTRDRLVRVVFPEQERRRKLAQADGDEGEEVVSLYEVQMLPLTFQSIPGLSAVRVSCILEVRNGGSQPEPSAGRAAAAAGADGAARRPMRGMAISMRDVRISNLPPDMLALTERGQD